MDQRDSNPGAYPPPGPAPEPSKKKSKFGCGCLTLVGGVVLVVIIAAAVSSGTKNTAGASISVTTSTAQAPAAPAAPATTAAPVKTVVLKASGSGIKNTKSFTTGPDWSIKYSFDCSNFGSTGNFQVYVYTDGQLTDTPVNALAASGADVSYEHGEPGTQYLQINSECSWSVTVTDGDSGQ